MFVQSVLLRLVVEWVSPARVATVFMVAEKKESRPGEVESSTSEWCVAPAESRVSTSESFLFVSTVTVAVFDE